MANVVASSTGVSDPLGDIEAWLVLCSGRFCFA